MAFFGKLKSVFGFSGEEYEIEENELGQRDATVTPLAQRRHRELLTAGEPASSEPANTPAAALPEQDVPAEPVKTNCPEAIFTKVVEIFNQSLPEFLRESVDPDKQARYIHDALDSSMQSYIEQLDRDADARIRAKLENDRTSLRQEIETLREKAKKIEESSTEWQEQKLSAERQKRALSERVHDLEKQIDAFNAEKEQYELENRSLVNKLRAVSIQDTDLEALRSDNETLRKELKDLKESGTTTATPAVDQRNLKELNALKDKVEELTAQKENIVRERTMMANDIIVLKKKCEISDAMINDLNHKASAAKLALAEKEKQYDDLQSRYDILAADASDSRNAELAQKLTEALALIETRNKELDAAKENIEDAHAELQRVNAELHNESVKVQQLTDDIRSAKEDAAKGSDSTAGEIASRDAEIARLNEELSAAKAELNEAREEVNESRASLEAFEESLVKIDEINETRQNRIAELQQQIKDAEEKLSDATKELADSMDELTRKDNEIASLKAAIQNNMQLQAASEALLREEIERLRKSPETTTRTKRKRAAKISSIDESLDDTNWLVSTPPEGTNARPGGMSDSEFGYQEPHHRDEPNNPAQMSLW